MTAPASMPGVTQVLADQLALFQALLLLVSGLHKLFWRQRLQTVVQTFAGLPRSAAPLAVVTVAGAELLAALSLLSPAYRAPGAMLSVLIFAGYLGLILRAIGQGRRDVDCGCTFGAARPPLGAYQVARNVVLTGAAVFVAAASISSATGSSATALSAAASSVAVPPHAPQLLAAFALLALYVAVDQVMALQPLRSGALR